MQYKQDGNRKTKTFVSEAKKMPGGTLHIIKSNRDNRIKVLQYTYHKVFKYV